MRQTHTVALMEVSKPAYDEIRTKLEEVGYGHAIFSNGKIDMTGLALIDKKSDPNIALFGSDLLPSTIPVGANSEVALGDLVRQTFADSNLTVEQWNALPTGFRDGMLAATLQNMRSLSDPRIQELRLAEGRYVYVAEINGVLTDLTPYGNRLPESISR